MLYILCVFYFAIYPLLRCTQKHGRYYCPILQTTPATQITEKLRALLQKQQINTVYYASPIEHHKVGHKMIFRNFEKPKLYAKCVPTKWKNRLSGLQPAIVTGTRTWDG